MENPREAQKVSARLACKKKPFKIIAMNVQSLIFMHGLIWLEGTISPIYIMFWLNMPVVASLLTMDALKMRGWVGNTPGGRFHHQCKR